MTDKQWKFWEGRNMRALIARYGPRRAKRELEKLIKKAKKNEALLSSCQLHDFDWRKALERGREHRARWGVELPALYGTMVVSGYCRCKNCGGKMSIMYAAPYMDAVEQMKKNESLRT